VTPTALLVLAVLGLLIGGAGAIGAKLLQGFSGHDLEEFCQRRHRQDRFDDILSRDDMAALGAEFLQLCVLQCKNIVISGGTGSGKTTFLNALSDAIPDQERIVTIEDAAELRLAQQHVISLEARPPNVEGKGQVTIRDLVRNALRMRPDRIVVGECRGGEALDMLQAMNTGHDGSLTTAHANSPRDLLSRLEVMAQPHPSYSSGAYINVAQPQLVGHALGPVGGGLQ